MGKSMSDMGASLLIVSQFTLMEKTDKGRRPDFTPAMPPDDTRALFDNLVGMPNRTIQTLPQVNLGRLRR